MHGFSAEAVQKIKKLNLKIENIDLFSGIYEKIRNNEPIMAVEVLNEMSPKENFWYDMGTPDGLLEAQRDIFAFSQQHEEWGQVLSTRYPGIQKLSTGVWVWGVSANNISKIEIRSPAVLICHDSTKLQVHEIGPNACVIADKGTHFFKKVPIQESVVVLRSSTESQMPIRNSVSVIRA